MLGSYARQPWKVFILILALLIICLPSCFVKNGFRFWRTCCFLNGACFSVTLWIFWLVYHKRGGLHINFLVKKIISRSIKNCWTSHAASNKHSSIMISSQVFVTTKITEWHGGPIPRRSYYTLSAVFIYTAWALLILYDVQNLISGKSSKIKSNKIQYWNHVVNILFYGKIYADFRLPSLP